MKIVSLYWVTDKLCQLRSAKLDNGKIQLGKRTFSVDKSQPYFFMSGGFLRRKLSPLYILKHNTPYPISMPVAESKLKYSSENITNLLEMKTLDNILQTPGQNKTNTIMFLLIGSAIGGLVSAVLFLTHVIHV